MINFCEMYIDHCLLIIEFWGSRKDAKAQRESFDSIAGQTGFSATDDTYRDEQNKFCGSSFLCFVY